LISAWGEARAAERRLEPGVTVQRILYQTFLLPMTAQQGLSFADASLPGAAEPPSVSQCLLCQETGGVLVFQAPQWRLIRAEDAQFPAFYRLVWQSHVGEFSDLSDDEAWRCMQVLRAAEQVLRERLLPTKINIASLGNVVPHLHWHLIARFDWDSHFPQPVWATAQRAPVADAQARLATPLNLLDEAMRQALQALA